jgi:topoisomerase IV subunit B
MRIEQVLLRDETDLESLLRYYMGKNTPERQDFIIDNLRFELDEVIAGTDGEEAALKEEGAEVVAA